MNTPWESVESELVDVSAVRLSTLRGQDPDVYAGSLDRLLRQIERPRVNVSGGDGPPRRAD